MLSATIAALEAELKWTFLAEYESCRRISYRAVGGGLIQGDRASEIDIVSPDMPIDIHMDKQLRPGPLSQDGPRRMITTLGRFRAQAQAQAQVTWTASAQAA